MKTGLSKYLLVAILALLPPAQSVAQGRNYHFFPVRPTHVSVMYAYGILNDYRIGNDTAGISMRKADGTLEQFFLASPAIVNGEPYNAYVCLGVKSCPMPHIVLKRTKVRVTYWMQQAAWGRLEKVSNVIDSHLS